MKLVETKLPSCLLLRIPSALANQLKLLNIKSELYYFLLQNQILVTSTFDISSFCQILRMDIAQSQLWIKMSELFQNKDNADVTLVCEGETILAHSAILELRWEDEY